MAFQLKCFKKIEQFKEKGKTILFVTHSITDVLKNCTRVIILNKGSKIFDGEVKEGVERYKKIIVGLSPEESRKASLTDEEILENPDIILDEKNKETSKTQTKTWKENFNENPNLIDYGNGKAEVIDYGIFNTDGKNALVIENDKEIILKSKIKFNEDVSEPIYTMTVKNFNGTEITGTNTMYERISTGKVKKGEIVEVEFRQILNIAPGKYTLSFSCTRFNEKGELEVLNRKYDALLIEILSMKECVGIMRIDSKIKITKI